MHEQGHQHTGYGRDPEGDAKSSADPSTGTRRSAILSGKGLMTKKRTMYSLLSRTRSEKTRHCLPVPLHSSKNDRDRH